MSQLASIYGALPIALTQLSFLFVILPVFILAYYITPQRFRPWTLLAASLIFYSMAQWGNLLPMCASVVADYAALRIMAAFDHNQQVRRGCLAFSVVKNLGIIVYFGALVEMTSAAPLLGVQLYTLSAMGCVLAVYQRQLPYVRSIVRFGVYCCFFPALYAGPLLLYQELDSQLGGTTLRISRVLEGMGQLVGGVLKTAILGGQLYALYGAIRKLPEVTALSSWATVFCVAFALYFMLSGFGDMAGGIGAMFGLALPRNFYYPYQSRSVADFFDRFNITVSRYIRRTVYLPLQEGKNGPLADALNILVVGILMGLWFGLRLNYLVWGAYFALFIVLEKHVYPRLLKTIPTLFCRVGTLCIVLASFTIFLEDSLLKSMELIRSMLDFSRLFDDGILYLLSSNWLLLVLSCFLATNCVNLVAVKFRRAAPALAGIVLGLVDGAILVVYVALVL